jgi:hypothetical protein
MSDNRPTPKVDELEAALERMNITKGPIGMSICSGVPRKSWRAAKGRPRVRAGRPLNIYRGGTPATC